MYTYIFPYFWRWNTIQIVFNFLSYNYILHTLYLKPYPCLFSSCRVFLSDFLTLTLSLLPTPGVFWISHMPSVKPLMRTPLPYFILLPTYGTMFSGGRWPLRKEEKPIKVQSGLWMVYRGSDVTGQNLCVRTSDGSQRRRRGLVSCIRSPTYTPEHTHRSIPWTTTAQKYTAIYVCVCLCVCLCSHPRGPVREALHLGEHQVSWFEVVSGFPRHSAASELSHRENFRDFKS